MSSGGQAVFLVDKAGNKEFEGQLDKDAHLDCVSKAVLRLLAYFGSADRENILDIAYPFLEISRFILRPKMAKILE